MLGGKLEQAMGTEIDGEGGDWCLVYRDRGRLLDKVMCE